MSLSIAAVMRFTMDANILCNKAAMVRYIIKRTPVYTFVQLITNMKNHPAKIKPLPAVCDIFQRTFLQQNENPVSIGK